MTASMVCVILDGCGKKSIDEGSLPQARFTRYLRLFSTPNPSINPKAALLTIMVNAAPRFATILCLQILFR